MAHSADGTDAQPDKRLTAGLLRAYHERGDAAARGRLIELHLPLVEMLARRHARRREDLEDLVQVGSIGLINAIDRFELERGLDLTAYAVPNITGEIKRHIRDRSSSVRVPRRLQEASTRARRAETQLASKLGRAPTSAELARDLGVDRADLARALDSERARVPLPLSNLEGSSEPAAEASGDPLHDSEDRLLLARAFQVLDEHERRIIYMRFIEGASRNRMADELGVSQRQLSRRLGKALSKLRAELEDPGAVALSPHADGPKMKPMAVGTAPKVQHFLDLPYHIVLVRDQQGGANEHWSARVEEFPGCEAHADTPEAAAQQISNEMQGWIAGAIAKGAQVPEPKRDSQHSGRLLLRIPRTLHTELARKAEVEDTSLNGLITSMLSGEVSGERAAQRSPPRSRVVSLVMMANLVVLAIAGIAAIGLLLLAWQQGW